jgi:hypothetical protein
VPPSRSPSLSSVRPRLFCVVAHLFLQRIAIGGDGLLQAGSAALTLTECP